MYTPSEPNVEQIGIAGGSSVDVEMVRFLRDEIKSAVHHELHTTVGSPPSYDYSEPLLSQDTPMFNPDEGTSAIGQDINKQKLRDWRFWLYVFAVAFPMLAMILSMPILTISHIDELEISVLAFFLVLMIYGVALGVGGVVTVSAPT
jgi:hypothetical protein